MLRDKFDLNRVVYTFDTISGFSEGPVTSKVQNDTEIFKAGDEKLVRTLMMASED